MKICASAFFIVTCAVCALAQAPAPPPPNDYTDGKNWLCRPGREDACSVDLTTTIVAADGTFTREPSKRHSNPPIDCFYVYPTVSADPTPNSDMIAGPEERRIVASQFARFASECRLFAPMYRQISLAGLRAGYFTRSDGAAVRAIAYNDVRDAWREYLDRDNHGRGIVLIGHSQGSFMLSDLVHAEIDGKPIQARLVSAILLGMSLPVPKDKNVGGAFEHVALCRSATQTGCVISYAAFRATSPPPPDTLFGTVPGGMVAACTNPAALDGAAADVHAYFDVRVHPFASAPAAFAWVTPARTIDTPFISVPGLLSAQCVSDEHGSYLAVTVHGDPSDPRTDDIAGDLVSNGRVNPAWGLHLIDVNLTMGDLIRVVHRQAETYGRR